MLPGVKIPVMVNGTETAEPSQNGEPVTVPVVIVCAANAKAKNLFVLMAFEALTPFKPGVPNKSVYGPVNEALPPMIFSGAMAVCRVKETELFVKFPDVNNDQYSVLLIETIVPSFVPPEGTSNASTCAETVPVPVVGLTNAKGK